MDIHLLQTLVNAHGVSGDEQEVRELLASLCTDYADDMITDPMGSLIVHRRGFGPKILLAAHMDTVGCVITHIEKNGFLRFSQVGGLDPASILQAPVRFRNGVLGLISCNDDQVGKQLNLRNLFIDIGARDEQDAKRQISVGDTAAFATPWLENNSKVISPYMDNRAGCAVLVEVLRRVQSRKNDLYIAFTAQEELGMRGAGPVSFRVEPDWALAVDVTCPDDLPGPLHEGTTALGAGAAIKMMDHRVLCARSVVEKLKQLAHASKIPCQMDLLSCGGTDAGPMQISRGGVPTGGVSIPCRYTHAPTELIAAQDYDAVVELITAFCESEL